MSLDFIIIAGPTAVGKSDLAEKIAKKIPSTIINADSMQLYDHLKILTNRPNISENKKISYKLYGVLNSNKKADVGWWMKNAKKEILNSKKIKQLPIVVGGTGMYIGSLENNISEIPEVKNRIKNKVLKIHKKYGNLFFYKKLQKIDPKLAQKISVNDTQRLIRAIEVRISSGKTLSFWQSRRKSKINYLKNYLFFIVSKKREDLYNSIDKRFDLMIKDGLLDEVKNFLRMELVSSHPINKVIGLRHIKSYIKGSLELEKAIELCKKDTRNYAKRQLTWFKHQPINPIYLDYKVAENFILKKLDDYL